MKRLVEDGIINAWKYEEEFKLPTKGALKKWMEEYYVLIEVASPKQAIRN
jgi:hypothetical protein